MNYKILSLLLITSSILSQNLKSNFAVLKELTANILDEETNYYPLKDGDLWEYIVNNSDTLLGERTTEYSFIKEVIKDTLMNNGKVYKQIKFCSCANTSHVPVEYFYQRKDSSGNVYEYVEGEEYKLFDFGLEIGETYESKHENHWWKLVKKYTVIGFGDTLKAIDFHLVDQNDIERQIFSIIENFGLTFFSGTPGGFSNFPDWDFWGAIIDSVEYGELIASDRRKTDWSLYYPLHVGDIWKYEHHGSIIVERSRIEVVKDTLLLGQQYFIKDFQRTYLNTLSEGRSSIERFDSTGILYTWKNNAPKVSFKFSKCIGDTFHVGSDYPLLLIDKKDKLDFMIIPDIANAHLFYSDGLGLVGSTGELTWSGLVGAFIDGELIWADTSIITSIDRVDEIPKKFILHQNYPNPFNPNTAISYELPVGANVKLVVYDVLGREIIILVNEEQNPGTYTANFNSQGLSSGMYIYRIEAGKFIQTKKMLLLK